MLITNYKTKEEDDGCKLVDKVVHERPNVSSSPPLEFYTDAQLC